jgi:hypothetical protein
MAGGIAFAAIPDEAGVIHGCYTTKGGVLRVIDSGASCTTKETALDWNQTGPQGPPGSTGSAGVNLCADTTVSGGTDDTPVTSWARSYSRLVEQFALVFVPSPTTFVCAGRVSNLHVTASGPAGQDVPFPNRYVITVEAGGPDSLGCTIAASSTSCSADGDLDVDPGSEVSVVIQWHPSLIAEGDFVPRHFDWSAEVGPPAAVYP